MIEFEHPDLDLLIEVLRRRTTMVQDVIAEDAAAFAAPATF